MRLRSPRDLPDPIRPTHSAGGNGIMATPSSWNYRPMKQPSAIAPAASPVTAAGSLPAVPGSRRRPRLSGLVLAAGLASLAGCVAGGGAGPLVADQRVVVEGAVAGVDTSPMAYDGNALVRVTTTAHGTVTVHLPARRNLCQAQGFELLEELRPGDRVRVEGLATGPGDISVCQSAADRLQRIE